MITQQVSLTAAEAYGDADPAALIKVPRGMAPDVKQGDKARAVPLNTLAWLRHHACVPVSA